jgi:hypothetical protein
MESVTFLQRLSVRATDCYIQICRGQRRQEAKSLMSPIRAPKTARQQEIDLHIVDRLEGDLSGPQIAPYK